MLSEIEYDRLVIHCEIHARGYGGDLAQHVILTVLECGYEEKNYLPLLKRIAYNQAHNPHSTFNKQYRPKKLDTYLVKMMYEEDTRDERILIVEKAIQKPPQTNREMFVKEVALELLEKSATQLSNETGISKRTLLKAKNRYYETIRNSNF